MRSSETCAIHDDSSDEHSEPSQKIQIERERKPYVAREGGGKVYDDSANSSNVGTLKRPGSESATGKPRTLSTAGEGNYAPRDPSSTRAGDQDAPTTPLHRTFSKRRPRSGTGTSNNPHVKLESNVSEMPSAHYTSNIYADSVGDVDSKYLKDSDRERRSARDSDRHTEWEWERERERDRERDRERERERKDRERDRRERERELREREAELEYARRRAEEDDTLYRSRSHHADDEYYRRPGPSAAPSNGFSEYQYPPPPVERRFG